MQDADVAEGVGGEERAEAVRSAVDRDRVEQAVGGLDERSRRIGAVGGGEVVQGSHRAGVVEPIEDADVVRAAEGRDAVEVPVARVRGGATGGGAVHAREVVHVRHRAERVDRKNVPGQEECAGGRAVEVAVPRGDQLGRGLGSVRSAEVEEVQRLEGARRGDVKHGSPRVAHGPAALLGRSVEIAARALDQAGDGRGSVGAVERVELLEGRRAA